MKSDAAQTTRVLLVDDNPHGLTARGMILAEQGYGVETASTGEEAWELIQKTQYDVVVTAYALKGVNGAGLIGRVRAAGLPARLILLVTHTEMLSFAAHEMGADEVISKSAREVTELLRALRKLSSGSPGRFTAPPRRPPSSTGRRNSKRGNLDKAAGA
jgi:DNA-binding response OmpR family regulator